MSRRKSIFVVNQETQTLLKQQEEQLADEIDQNLRTLALVHPMSDSAKNALFKGAFMKPNKLSFQHVVHYLVLIINGATDFRKRFRWPITTMKDETDFRSSVLVYFNECQKNYKWHFGPFKMQVVLFPGGVEFMKIIAELSLVAMRTILKENDCLQLLNSHGNIRLSDGYSKLKAAEDAYKEMNEFCSKIAELSTDIKAKTDRLQKVYSSLMQNISIPENIVNTSFLSDWEANQQTTINEKILPLLNELDEFSSKCDSFAQNIQNSKPQQINFDKDKMKSLGLLKISPNFTHQLDYNGIFKWFKQTMPELINAAYFKPPWTLAQIHNESQILDQYLTRANGLIARIDSLANINELMANITMIKDDNTQSNEMVYWGEKLMLTPTIKCCINKDRVAIWELMPTVDSPSRLVMCNFKQSFNDSKDDGTFDGDLEVIDAKRALSSKLDPMLMLNAAMQRKKGFNKTMASPRRNIHALSPARQSSHQSSPVHSSTMIASMDQTCSRNRSNFSPLRKSLF